MRLIQKAWSYFQIDVSIHASVKDATKKTYNRFITNDVSIHASVKDATDIINLSIHSHKFQSTHL